MSGRVGTMPSMRVGVVDVGSNTVRLLVAGHRGDRLEPLVERRAYLALGAEIDELGWISAGKLAEAVVCVRRYVREARDQGCHDIAIVVTAPGRSAANAAELVAALGEAASASVRVLSAEEEASLAFAGATLTDSLPATVAVCDSGGGSTEVAIGTPAGGPVWLHSFEVGSLTILRRYLGDDPPGKDALAEARAGVRELFAGVAPPLPKAALATGGAARALRRVGGRKLRAKDLDDALRVLARQTASEVAHAFHLDLDRARTLPGGAVILAELQFRLGVPLEVSRAGMREGVAAAALARLAAA